MPGLTTTAQLPHPPQHRPSEFTRREAAAPSPPLRLVLPSAAETARIGFGNCTNAGSSRSPSSAPRDPVEYQKTVKYQNDLDRDPPGSVLREDCSKNEHGPLDGQLSTQCD